MTGAHRQMRPTQGYMPMRLWKKFEYVAKLKVSIASRKMIIPAVAWYSFMLTGLMQPLNLWLYLAIKPPKAAPATPITVARPNFLK